MKQSRLMSLIEAIANVGVGYGVAVTTQLLVFPWFGLPARVADALALGAIFTVVSVIRCYMLRRLFEAIRVRAPSGATFPALCSGKCMPPAQFIESGCR